MIVIIIILFISLILYISANAYAVTRITENILDFEFSEFPNKKYIERLVKEWMQHEKIVLSIDYDSSISFWKSIDNREDIQKCVNLILTVQHYTYNVIHTACSPDRHKEILEYCQKIGIRVDSINVNPIQLPYGKNDETVNSKIFYNHQLCDRSGLLESMDILEKAYYVFRGKKQLEKYGRMNEIG